MSTPLALPELPWTAAERAYFRAWAAQVSTPPALAGPQPWTPAERAVEDRRVYNARLAGITPEPAAAWTAESRAALQAWVPQMLALMQSRAPEDPTR